jgi:carbamoyltransferase
MHILGLSCFYHDAAAALLREGEIVAAAQEERFTRNKGDASFPRHSIEFCLREAGIVAADLDAVIFYDKPLLKFERILDTYLSIAPAGITSFMRAIPVWAQKKLWMRRVISRSLDGYRGKVLFGEHHESHAASAFFPSPFEESAILTVDGVGEWATASVGAGRGARVEILQEMMFPNSLGLLYAAFTAYTGFKVNSGEYKVMGLAPYGEPRYVDVILKELVDLREDGSLRLNLDYFDYLGGLTMTNRKFHQLFGGPPRVPESKLTQKDMDLARSVQEVCQMSVLRMARHAAKVTGMRNLCMAGGVALNCVANGKILQEKVFDRMWIQPAASDSGGAVGAALVAWHHVYGQPRNAGQGRDSMKGGYLGPEFSQQDIESFLRGKEVPFRTLTREDIVSETARLLARGNVVGWFQGRMEFGPRALGSRSILGDARDPTMQARMNIKIKKREGFRPFAPSVLRERVADYFEMDCDSPYMLLVAPVKKHRQITMTEEQKGMWGIDKLNVPRSDIPAVTHIDYSARVQTVRREDHPLYYDLLKRFEQETGCAVLVNTSFNIRGEPIVCTPEDAFRCFATTGIDYLVMGCCIVDKKELSANLLQGAGAQARKFGLD